MWDLRAFLYHCNITKFSFADIIFLNFMNVLGTSNIVCNQQFGPDLHCTVVDLVRFTVIQVNDSALHEFSCFRFLSTFGFNDIMRFQWCLDLVMV